MLTKKRKAWAAKRTEAPTFKGHRLANNVGVSTRYAERLSALVTQMTEQVTREVLRMYRAEGNFAQDATIASQSRILMSTLQSKFNDLFARNAKRLAESMVEGASKASTTSLHSSLEKLSGGLSLKTSAMPPQVVEIYKAAVAENVALVKSISTDYLNQVQGSVMRSITSGRGLEDLVPALQKYEGVTHRRARNIALDQTRKTYNQINRGRMQALGVKSFMWHHSGGGAHPREDHVEMDGKVYRFDDPPVIDERTGERGIPGQAVNCFPSDSNVEFPHGVNKLFRRWYSGELFSVITNNGVILEATGNHPVLTQRGWVAIKDVDVGDNLVYGCDESRNIGKANVKRDETGFGEVFDSAATLFFERSATAPGSAFQFHGDGTDEEIEVVFSDSVLSDECDASFCQRLCEFVLTFADLNDTINVHFDKGSLDQFIGGSFFASNSVMRGAHSLLALLSSDSAGGHDARQGLVTYLHARFNESTPDDVAGHAEIFGHLKLAQSADVSGDKFPVREIFAACGRAGRVCRDEPFTAEKLGEVVRVDPELRGDLSEPSCTIQESARVLKKSVREFSGFVHNAETPTGWYVVNGFIVHNCKCTMSPVFDFSEAS